MRKSHAGLRESTEEFMVSAWEIEQKIQNKSQYIDGRIRPVTTVAEAE